jgi:hypothetical protein
MSDEIRNRGMKPDGRFKPGKPPGVVLAERLASKDIGEIVNARLMWIGFDFWDG